MPTSDSISVNYYVEIARSGKNSKYSTIFGFYTSQISIMPTAARGKMPTAARGKPIDNEVEAGMLFGQLKLHILGHKRVSIVIPARNPRIVHLAFEQLQNPDNLQLLIGLNRNIQHIENNNIYNCR